MKKIVINFFIGFLILALSPACQALSTNFINRGGKHCTGYCEIENIICEKSKDKQGYYDWCQKNCTHEKKKNRNSFVDAIAHCNSLIKCQARCTKDKIICTGQDETYSQCKQECGLKFKNITEIKSGLDKCQSQLNKLLNDCQARCAKGKIMCIGQNETLSGCQTQCNQFANDPIIQAGIKDCQNAALASCKEHCTKDKIQCVEQDGKKESFSWCTSNCENKFQQDSEIQNGIGYCRQYIKTHDSEIVAANKKRQQDKVQKEREESQKKDEQNLAARRKQQEDHYNSLTPEQKSILKANEEHEKLKDRVRENRSPKDRNRPVTEKEIESLKKYDASQEDFRKAYRL